MLIFLGQQEIGGEGSGGRWKGLQASRACCPACCWGCHWFPGTGLGHPALCCPPHSPVTSAPEMPTPPHFPTSLCLWKPTLLVYLPKDSPARVTPLLQNLQWLPSAPESGVGSSPRHAGLHGCLCGSAVVCHNAHSPRKLGRSQAPGHTPSFPPECWLRRGPSASPGCVLRGLSLSRGRLPGGLLPPGSVPMLCGPCPGLSSPVLVENFTPSHMGTCGLSPRSGCLDSSPDHPVTFLPPGLRFRPAADWASCRTGRRLRGEAGTRPPSAWLQGPTRGSLPSRVSAACCVLLGGAGPRARCSRRCWPSHSALWRAVDTAPWWPAGCIAWKPASWWGSLSCCRGSQAVAFGVSTSQS